VARFPRNRLVRHLMDNCVLRYACPAARNLCLGRYEAPLPVSRSCNARCVGCISRRDDSAPFRATPQDRLTFTPSVDELVEVMLHHQSNETNAPLYSFGQGCEGEPLTEADLLVETVRVFRAKGGKGTVNLNSNASLPRAVARLAGAGLTSLRVTLNSARPAAYDRYHRPGNYCFGDVRQSIREARSAGVFVSLNLLYFPGITDGEEELEALGELIGACDVQYVQLRNLNIDPELYLRMQEDLPSGPAVGLVNFCRRLKKIRPGLTFGYFNPAVARTDEGERG
jgi:MoaA/NifB/PqqE/SkfB family radical SAM enzyme